MIDVPAPQLDERRELGRNGYGFSKSEINLLGRQQTREGLKKLKRSVN